MTTFRPLRTFLAAAATAALLPLALPTGLGPAPAAAQSLFAPVVTVNGRSVTRWELDQRVALLRALRAAGDLEDQALNALINERLQSRLIAEAGISLSAEALATGIEEFAGRNGVDTEGLLAVLGERGVAEETLRDFISAGLLWRDYVNQRFSAQARVTPAEVDRFLESRATETDIRVRLSEIILPARIEVPGETEASLDRARDIQATARSEADFARAAVQYSVSPSRTIGGIVRNALTLSELPPQLGRELLTMRPGQISEPVPISENAFAIFRLRSLEEVGPRPARNVSVDYVTIALPGAGTPETAARLADLAETDGCEALYPKVRGPGQDALQRQTEAISSLPSDLRFEIAKLDAGEVSTALTRNGGETRLFVMLCARLPETEEDARALAEQQLFNQRLASISEGFLDAVRADAFIARP